MKTKKNKKATQQAKILRNSIAWLTDGKFEIKGHKIDQGKVYFECSRINPYRKKSMSPTANNNLSMALSQEMFDENMDSAKRMILRRTNKFNSYLFFFVNF